MRLTLGYPDAAAERALLAGDRQPLKACGPLLTSQDLVQAREAIAAVRLAEPLLDYLQALTNHTRRGGYFVHGLSPRAVLGLAQAARVWAWLEGRDYVTPDDVQAVFPAVAGHRLLDAEGAMQGDQCADRVLGAVAIP